MFSSLTKYNSQVLLVPIDYYSALIVGSSLNDQWNVVCTDATRSTLKIYNIMLQLTMLLSTMLLK